MGVTFWGFTDAHAWLNEPGHGGPDYPLLSDENYQPKPAY
jgi:GH35 family endo-1,4-beta-xylanase